MYIVYILDMLHMTQKPHWHVGPCHLTIKSLQVIEQFASFTSRGRLFQILEPWLAELFIPKLIVFTFGWTNLDPPRAQLGVVEKEKRELIYSGFNP